MCPRLLLENEREFIDPEFYCSCALIDLVRKDERQKRTPSQDWIDGYNQGLRDSGRTPPAPDED